LKTQKVIPSNNDNKVKTRVNHQIRAKEIRLIDHEGKMIGVVSVSEALRMAELRELDLVEISPNANPPVCKIMDFAKFIYEQQKREKVQKKQQSSQQLKELRFTARTASHDFNFKVRHAREFLTEGNKVKATVMFRGREIVHQKVGEDLLNKLIEEVQDIAKLDSPPKLEGKKMSIMLSPDKTKIAKIPKKVIKL
jgi:translation initiation factor IF-3